MLEVIPSPSFAAMTTLNIGGRALAELRLHSIADCDALPAALAKFAGNDSDCIRIIGGGSNVLAAEGDVPMVLINSIIGAANAPELVGEEIDSNGRKALVRACAGQGMPSLLAWCAAQGFSGLEGLVGVPGRLGGAVAMNAGAYGCSLGLLLRTLTVFTPEYGVEVLLEKDWRTAYRQFSLIKPCTYCVVLEATLALGMNSPEQVSKTMRANIMAKKSTQPLHEHTAGCVFKNPEGYSAGKLLERAGFRGRREGYVYFSDKHANFLAHDHTHAHAARHAACGSDGSFHAAATLIAQAREAVARQSGINLELEVKVWPCPLF